MTGPDNVDQIEARYADLRERRADRRRAAVRLVLVAAILLVGLILLDIAMINAGAAP